MDNTKSTITLNPRALLFSTLLVLMPFSLFMETHTKFTQIAYIDEILCIICIGYLLYLPFKLGLKSTDVMMIVLMVIIMAIGLLGNIAYKIIPNWFNILVDVLCLAKVILPFIVFKFLGELDRKMLIARYLIPISKLIILASTLFGSISLFFDIGMNDEKRYGIPAFYFIFANGSRFGYIIACAALILIVTKIDPRKLLLYEIMAVYNIILTTKGVVYIVLFLYFFLLIAWRKKEEYKFSFGNIIFLVFGGVAVSSFQIQKYLFDLNSPRMTLIQYGFKTAKTYFPFGSGFSTYGSDMAARLYSPLYSLYGFNNMYGMNMRDRSFLNDCYLGMVFGQFGYIGAIAFAFVIILMFSILYKADKLGKNAKAMSLAIFLGLIISSAGTAIIKSSIGVMVLCILGLMCGYANQNDDKVETNIKLNY